ncbi:MAG: alpha/beta hydrolase [Polaromonas sp.]|nr:alpha/beta hydrolase [Polaromonas sp.]
MLLLPGLMCDHAFWQPLLDAPALGVSCLVVDYGDADTLTAMAQAVLAVAPPVFSLAGHSMGGRVALEVVRLAPERIERLILMDTGHLARVPGEKGETEKAGRMALLAIAEKDGVRAMAAEWVKGMVHPDRLGDAELIEAIVTMFERKTAARFARQQNALLSRPDGSPVLVGLKVPCMVLCGRQDAWANVEQHQAIQALAPHASLVVIEDAGHMVLMEKPEPTIQAIKEFMSK